jgi:hypothetical protein
VRLGGASADRACARRLKPSALSTSA